MMTQEARKKIISAALSFAAVIAVTVAFIVIGITDFGGNESYGETFIGYVSRFSYMSADAAARGFVQVELSGATASPKYSGYRRVDSLSAAEIAKLNGRELTDAEIESGESVVIEYVNDDVEREIEAFLLKTSGGYEYYVFPPTVGAR